MSCSKTTPQWRRWGSNPRLLGLESRTLPLSNCAPWNQFKPSSKIFYWRFQGCILLLWFLYVFSVLCLLCLCGLLFICALWSPAGKGLTSWLSSVVSNCEFVTFPLVSWVRCATWLYRFLIFAPLLTLIWIKAAWHSDIIPETKKKHAKLPRMQSVNEWLIAPDSRWLTSHW